MKEYVAIKNKTFRAIQLTKEVTLEYLGYGYMQKEGDVVYGPEHYVVFLGNGDMMVMAEYEFARIFEEKNNPKLLVDKE